MMLIDALPQSTSLVRIAAFFLAWVLVWSPIGVGLAVVLGWRPPQLPSPTQKLPLVGSLYLFAPPLLWGIAQWEGVPFSSYGLNWPSSLGIGLIAGIGLGMVGLGVLFGMQWGLGWLQWQPDRWSQVWGLLLPTLLIGLLISLIEEWVFRGFLLNQFEQITTLGLAATLSSAIFALLHLVWEGGNALPQLPGLWLMGMVLTLARWANGGDLSLAIGLHAGWIWGIASVDSTQILSYTGRETTWLTGVGQKPLAGGFGFLFLLGTGAILWFIA